MSESRKNTGSKSGAKVMPHNEKYIEYFGDDCPLCGGKIYTTNLDEDESECIDCKAKFELEE